MVSPSRAEGDNFVMGEEAINKIRPTPREPMSSEDRFWLWFWAILGVTAVTLATTIWVGVVIYTKTATPEQMCAGWRDPPEFCRELAKRPKQ